MLIVNVIENNTMYSVQELHLCLFLPSLAEVILAGFTSSTCLVHSSTNLSTIFLIAYSFYSLNIDQHHMIYHIHIHNYKDSK